MIIASFTFGQKNDQIFSKFPEISFTTANNGNGIGAKYRTKFFSLEASSFKMAEGRETAINNELSVSALIIDQNIDHTSVVYKVGLGISQRDMNNTLSTWGDDRMYPDTITKVVTRVFLAAGFRHRDLAKRPFIPLREIGLEVNLLPDSNITSFSLINTFLIQGPKVGKKGLEINPFLNWGVDNREVQRFSPALYYSLGLKLRLYDYKKYYSVDILSLEYIGGNQAERTVSSYRVTVNLLGLVGFLSRKSAKKNQEECNCKKYSYTAKTFPIPAMTILSLGAEETLTSGELSHEGKFQKFTDLEISK